ncbi:MAG TPA: exodeoxyribonuclease VII small subunit [Longilinea sp.]|nr:exodeoxyribonuclease VII small subunit [Longilinea sp.]
MSKKKDQEIDNLLYEQCLEELEQVVTTLENSQPSLEEAMALFERGQALAKRASSLLEQAELRVQVITGQGELTPTNEE